MPRSRLFWIIFVAISAAAAVFTFRNFSTAFPIVSIDLQMDRADALRQARALTLMHMWPPEKFDQAAEFGADQELQNFIELEGGGKPELGRILKQKIFSLYTWNVRHFKEADAHETLLRFTPEGTPYGFRVKLPDQEKGPSIAAEEARRIAEDSAIKDWNIDFSRYQRVESSKADLPGGRTDHTFVYERQDERLREGRYRLRLVVGGDQLTELTHFVQIPEAFTRRYEQMRAANDAISAVDLVALIGIYALGFCGVGLFFMIRQRWVLWRQATIWALFIALLMALDQLNAWPLAWMGYDTALPASGFALRQFLGALGLFGGFGIMLTISFVAAETFSRRAFPHHVQLWKAWTPPVAASRTILGQTAMGYLLVAPFFAYEIILYFFAQQKLGWWSPSDTIANPNLFANYVPALSAIAQALQAGFWEECLFRAVPLATAALIGEKFGKRKLFIGGAMILQALVFASGHAGYANQPAYARVVELIIPSFAFGTIYLLFGLLPGIVLHFAYDATWMALPLFVASGFRAHVEQAIVIAAVLVPLGVVILNRVRLRRWTELPSDALNGSWQPPSIPAPVAAPTNVPTLTTFVPANVRRALPILGIAGLLLWIFSSPFRTDAPPLNSSRAEAERQAREVLVHRGVDLDASWTVLSEVQGQPGQINRFVWQTAGKSVYTKLLGEYVTPPSWVVRFARFHGDVAQRAEEYQVFIRGDAQTFRVTHALAEATPGKNLSESDARAIAVAALPDTSDFKEISAQAAKRPARTDWTFVFKDTQDYGLPRGEPRISVQIAGDEVVDTARYVYVPEDWGREERARQNLPGIFRIVCTIIIIAIVVAAAVVGVVHWSRNRPFSSRAFFVVFATVFLIRAVNVLNSWPALAAQASTAQPLELQIGIGIVTAIVVGIFTAVGLGLVAGLIGGDGSIGARPPSSRAILIGVSIALVIAGTASMLRHVTSTMSPDWGNLAPPSTYLPFISAAFAPLSVFFTQTMILLTALYGIHMNRRHASAAWLVIGIAIAGASIETITSWLVIGVVTGVFLMLAYRLVFQHEPALILVTTTALVILSATEEAFQRMYPSALAGSLAGAVIVAIAGWIWFRGTMETQ